ncbi:SPOR domain-containing protein [Legionella cardiaca]|uniref:SPOR domain-containing protein n=1 Tax=Legionella cardiaca TaxID=1071983 RepID=A0ABY8AQA6_9GAMM|nr:SPOR domain-containing protein [Legionella cardiaca]WED41956.1 SPOR domain-containing protein [Legionella cardiaca]
MKNFKGNLIRVGLIICIPKSHATMLYDWPTEHINGQPPYYIQTIALKDFTAANRYAQNLRKTYPYPISIKKRGDFYKIIMGPIPNLNELSQSNYNSKTYNQQQVNSLLSLKTATGDSNSSSREAIMQTASWMLTGGVGLSNPDINDHIFVANGSDIPPYNFDTLSLHKKNMTSILGAISYGWYKDKPWFPAYSIGIRYQHLFSENVGGMVTQYSLPEFQNYTFNWKLSSNVWSLFTKINIAQKYHLSPFINGGIGGAFNKASTYQETPFGDVTARVSPGFKKLCNTDLSYHVGTGIDVSFSSAISASIGYEFQDLGSFSSTSGKYSWAGARLNLDKYRINSVYLTVSYVFGNRELSAHTK